MLLQLYFISILFSTLTMIYLNMKAYFDLSFSNKAKILMKTPTKHNKCPELFALIPVANVILACFVLWFISADVESIKKFMK
ncbi:hypothetical protein RSJ21_00120 (plasmid) [Clostridium botulinum]|uniref:hypothetical protein n=1 Tax=Clostridium botulinum TaxID=1491 RepID=UPI000C7747A9|nr:hypothetical protein [Clostridium botulinum]AUN23744.1 hypothetical protein RSJ21_00120 [Clostridium botulinum]